MARRVIERKPGAVVRAKEVREGWPIKTVVSRRPGVVLEVRVDSVLVQIGEEGEERRLHPDVFVEIG